MVLMIVSGRSGSGKSVALRALEDMGFYCVDNLPVVLLPDLARTLADREISAAVSIDVRNMPESPEIFEQAMSNLPDAFSPQLLFLDADLRKSVLMGRHRVAGEVKGLSHFLSGQVEIKDIILKTQEPNLYVAFAGVVPPNPSELLGNRRFEALLNGARQAYDYVIIDAPPLGSVIDAAVIAKNCDASVLVVASREISYKYARVVKEQLELAGCPILGVVLNKVDLKQNKYYGNKYYSKYYGKYYGEYKKED